jgi:ATP-dependent Clp protease ATP-binding subunit ClpC
MKKLTYPLLCYAHPDGGVTGMLLGNDLQVYGRDGEAARQQVNEFLRRHYQKHQQYPRHYLMDPQLRTIETKVRIGYKLETGAFLSGRQPKIQVPVVYGQSDQGILECYIPQLEEHFFCNDVKTMVALVQHFAARYFRELPPEKVNRLIFGPKPTLELAELKIKEKTTQSHAFFSGNSFSEKSPLERMADRYPPAGRKTAGLPQAAWEMDDWVNKLVHKIVVDRANLLLVGEPGTGKTTVLQAAARKIVQFGLSGTGQVFWQLVAQRITSSSKYLGEWQALMDELLDELAQSNDVLWITDLTHLLEIGGQGPEDSAAAFLKPFLEKNKVQVVGEATPQQLEVMRRHLPGFVEQFQILSLGELPENTVFAIMQKFAAFAKQSKKVELPRNTLELTFRLLKRFYPYERFPGKSIKFLGACLSEAAAKGMKTFAPLDAVQLFVRQTGLPEVFLRDEILLHEEALTQWFSERIIGQEEAVKHLCDVVKIFKAGLNNPKRPICVYVFAGPTGVGKTASAQALSDYFFGAGQKKSPLVRIDMSEFKHVSQLDRLLGSGNQTGQLVKEIRERPFAVLLLDEVEKADPSIFDALLTMLDEGLMTDHLGRVTNFRNTIVVLTTNLGASKQRAIGYEGGAPVSYESVLGKFFRPELVNRIDHIIGFKPLDKEAIRRIALKELNALCQRDGLSQAGILLRFSDRLVDRIAEVGFDERYGARPLQRAVDALLTTPLAHWLLEHPTPAGAEIHLDWDGQRVTYTIA